VPEAAEHDLRLLRSAALAGLVAIAALPLSVTLPGGRLLVFATPLCLGIVGRMHARPWLLNVAVLLAVLVGAAVLVDLPFVRAVAVGTILAGPILAVVAVGRPLRETDHLAAAAFLLGGTIAVIAGFSVAAVGRVEASSVVIGVVLGAAVVIGARLRPAEARRD
jgi:hypothetical protein